MDLRHASLNWVHTVFRQEYNDGICRDIESLSRLLESGVASIDEAREEEKRKAVRQNEEEEAGEMDEEGWTTVSRHTSKKPVGGLSGKAQAKVGHQFLFCSLNLNA